MLGRIVSDLIPNIARQRVIVLCILSTLISVVFMAACAGTKTELDFTSTQSLGVSNFQYSYLKIRPIEATPNERVLIDLDLTNTSGIEDSYSVELKINGAVEFTKNVDVPPGETWRLTFSAPTETEGIYEVTAGDVLGTVGLGNRTELMVWVYEPTGLAYCPFDFGTEDFTIDCWVRTPSYSISGIIFAQASNTTNND